MGHLPKVVNSLIGVCVQLVKSVSYLMKCRACSRGVSKDSLDRIDLGFINIQASFDWINGKRFKNSLTSIHSLMNQGGEDRQTSNFQQIKPADYSGDTVLHRSKIKTLTSGIKIIDVSFRAFKIIQAVLKAQQC